MSLVTLLFFLAPRVCVLASSRLPFFSVSLDLTYPQQSQLSKIFSTSSSSEYIYCNSSLELRSCSSKASARAFHSMLFRRCSSAVGQGGTMGCVNPYTPTITWSHSSLYQNVTSCPFCPC